MSARPSCNQVNTGGHFLRLRATALALRVLRLRATALALRVLRLRATALRGPPLQFYWSSLWSKHISSPFISCSTPPSVR
jgi:hypothetical protein